MAEESLRAIHISCTGARERGCEGKHDRTNEQHLVYVGEATKYPLKMVEEGAVSEVDLAGNDEVSQRARRETFMTLNCELEWQLRYNIFNKLKAFW